MTASITLIADGPGAREPAITEGIRRTACEVIVVGHRPGTPSTVDEAIAAATAPVVAVTAAAATIDGAGLAQAVALAKTATRYAIVYTDEIVGDRIVRKPDWSPTYLDHVDFLGRLVLLPRSLLVTVGGLGHDVRSRTRTLVMRAANTGTPIVHLPVLAHRGPDGGYVAVEPRAPALSTLSVSAVIPTAGTRARDGRSPSVRAVRALDALRRASFGIDLETLIVTGPEADADAIAESVDAAPGRVRLITDHAPFSFSRRVNLAAAQATGDVLLLLNDDVERYDGDGWLRDIASLALLGDVGAVGAQLLYPNGTIQHAGVYLENAGYAQHMLRNVPANASDVEKVDVPREVGAVTGAVLATRRSVFASVGGLSSAFPLNWNDIDYCYKVRRTGLRVLVEPRARLLHDESATRGPGVFDNELEVWGRRWPHRVEPYWVWDDDAGTVLRAPADGLALTPTADR